MGEIKSSRFNNIRKKIKLETNKEGPEETVEKCKETLRNLKESKKGVLCLFFRQIIMNLTMFYHVKISQKFRVSRGSTNGKAKRMF